MIRSDWKSAVRRAVKRCATALVALLIVSFAAAPASAVEMLAYSFESDIAGFTPNGLGIDMTQDTTGATVGTQAMKVSLTEGPTFVGALTQVINPTPGSVVLGNPPGIDYILFDMTIVNPYPTGEGKFANIGVTVFGTCCGVSGGFPVQFADEEAIGGKEAGVHTNLRIDLNDSRATPGVPAHQTFNQVFPQSPGPNDFVPSGLQFFFNQDGGSAFEVYLDNIRFGLTPAAIAGDYNGNGSVDAGDYVVWRNGGPLAPGTEVADPGTISNADFTEWRARFGNVAGSGTLASLAAVPEPAAGLLLATAAWSWGLLRHRRARGFSVHRAS